MDEGSEVESVRLLDKKLKYGVWLLLQKSEAKSSAENLEDQTREKVSLLVLNSLAALRDRMGGWFIQGLNFARPMEQKDKKKGSS